MLIVIEGADKTGKTTLAKAIAKQLGCEYVHFSAPKGAAPADEYIDFLLGLKRDTVCDRFHLGELVYGPLLRGKPGLSPLQLTVIERVMRLKQAVIIHAVTDMKLANKRLFNSVEIEAVNLKQNLAAARLFARVVPQTNAGPVLRYDGSSLEGINEVIRLLKLMAEQRVDTSAYTGIGTVTGSKLVLVGEQVNKNVTWRGLPFDKGMSSQFLLEMLDAACISEKAVYVCNADRLTEREARLLQRGIGTRFITLGAKAASKLTNLGILHTELPHPQFVKRFRYKQKSVYATQFKEAVCL